MSIKKKENNLFSEWEKQVNKGTFVRDGVVSEEDYDSSDLKILFILKEVNDSGGGGWDLRDYIRNGPRSQSWNTVTRWVKGIREFGREIKWEDIKKIEGSDRLLTLRSIAAMNLKKVPGGGSSNKSEIEKWANDNRDQLNRQFALYNADITICCGTGTIVKKVLDVSSKIKWKKTSRGITYGTFGNGKHIFSFHHPQARYPGHFKYYMLIDAVKEVIK